MPDGERYHVHLYAKAPGESFNALTAFSRETEVCRLDAKGTGDLPKKYRSLVKGRVKERIAAAKGVRGKRAKQPGKKSKVATKKRGGKGSTTKPRR
jgi:hypothetical protein